MIARTREELVALDDLTERILMRLIGRLHTARRFDYFERITDDAINWADLHCREAYFDFDSHGNEGNRVLIEEASPSSSRLMMYVWRFLKRCGYERVEVSIEW